MDKFRHHAVRYLLLAGAMLLAAQAHSHPYDSPLEFRLHKTDDGRNIYTNIPKKCFHGGVLTCLRLHPIIAGSRAPKSPPASPGNQ